MIKTESKGCGLRVDEACEPGDFIVEYVGEAVTKKSVDRMIARNMHRNGNYMFELSDQVYIDACHRGGIARYINHSCEPNCIAERWRVQAITRLAIFAKKHIEKGEELTFDYQWVNNNKQAPIKCCCSSPICRGHISAR